MGKFFEIYNLHKLTKEEIENLDRCTISEEIESIIKNCLPNEGKTQGKWHHWWILPCKEKLTPFSLKSSKSSEEKGTLLFLFYYVNFTLVANQTEILEEKEINLDQYPLWILLKFAKNISKLNLEHITGIIHHDYVGFFSWNAKDASTYKNEWNITLIESRNKNDMIISMQEKHLTTFNALSW